MTCAFKDCGRPDCHVCALARIPIPKLVRQSAKAAAGLRENAKASPKTK